MEPRLQMLLRQGERAARLGKQQAAEEVYRQTVEAFPTSAEAWLGLSEVAPSEEERATCYQRALELDPAVAEAADASREAGRPAPAAIAVEPLDAPLPDERRREPAPEAAHAGDAAGLTLEPAGDSARPAGDEQGEISSEVLFCANHPERPATLRCNRCNRPICVKCAVRTPVGYRCKSCIREQQEVFYDATMRDYLLATIVALPLGVIASFIIYGIGWLTVFVAPFAGMVVAGGVRLATQRRRGRWLPLAVGLCVVAGGFLGGAIRLFGFFFLPAQFSVLSLFWQGVFLVLAVSSAYYRVR